MSKYLVILTLLLPFCSQAYNEEKVIRLWVPILKTYYDIPQKDTIYKYGSELLYLDADTIYVYYPNKRLLAKGPVIIGKYDKIQKSHPDNNKSFYLFHGKWKYFYDNPNTQLMALAEYDHGIEMGNWTFFNEDGSIRAVSMEIGNKRSYVYVNKESTVSESIYYNYNSLNEFELIGIWIGIVFILRLIFNFIIILKDYGSNISSITDRDEREANMGGVMLMAFFTFYWHKHKGKSKRLAIISNWYSVFLLAGIVALIILGSEV